MIVCNIYLGAQFLKPSILCLAPAAGATSLLNCKLVRQDVQLT
jgi:hypothetical protein